jgi:uncharacterized protein
VHETSDQQALLNFLRQPYSFGDAGDSVEIRQTHISIVALTKAYAYKIKKPLNLGFLDFSTPEQRHAACGAEVQLNRRLSQDVYLGVLPIARNNAGLHFGSDGAVVDYAVQMRRLGEEGFLSWRLAHDPPSADELVRLVKKLSDFYRQQSSASEIATWGEVEKLRLSTNENFEQIEQFVGDLISRPGFEALRDFTELSYEKRRTLFERRCAEGRILDCHGDLRCEHVHFTGAQINIIDCIEFNDRFRYIDVANDIAFLAMDFDVRGHGARGNGLVEHLADSLGDPELLKLLDFYKCYRACVRGKVSAFKSSEPEVAREDSDLSRQKAARFFQRALRYAISDSQPFLLVVMGRVGTGKSTLARALAEAIGAAVFSSDKIRKELASVPLHERANADTRGRIYSEEMTRRTYEEMLSRALKAATTDGAAVVDATFGKHSQRELLRQKPNVRCLRVSLDVSEAEIKQRLQNRSGAEISDARLEDFEMLDAAYEHPDAIEQTEIVMVNSVSTLESTVTEVFQLLIRIDAH